MQQGRAAQDQKRRSHLSRGWQREADAGSGRDIGGQAQGTLRRERENSGRSEPSRKLAGGDSGMRKTAGQLEWSAVSWCCRLRCAMRMGSTEGRSCVALSGRAAGMARGCGCSIPWLLVAAAVVGVAIVVANPGHREFQPAFVAALGYQVKVVVRPDEQVPAPPVGGIGVEDRTGGVFVENAGARPFIARKLLFAVVVLELASRHLLRGERHVMVPL